MDDPLQITFHLRRPDVKTVILVTLPFRAGGGQRRWDLCPNEPDIFGVKTIPKGPQQGIANGQGDRSVKGIPDQDEPVVFCVINEVVGQIRFRLRDENHQRDDMFRDVRAAKNIVFLLWTDHGIFYFTTGFPFCR